MAIILWDDVKYLLSYGIKYDIRRDALRPVKDFFSQLGDNTSKETKRDIGSLEKPEFKNQSRNGKMRV
jgi:hypothetical protein